jgi:hypothetical protein
MAAENARLRTTGGQDEQAGHDQGRQHDAGFHGRNS